MKQQHPRNDASGDRKRSDPAPDGEHRGAVTPRPPDERRATPRYAPDALVPVLFGHRDAETPAGGLIDDVSLGGCRIIAAPNARPMLHWGDPFWMVVSYSEGSRAAGIEGLRLAAHVVRLVADARGLVVHCQFAVDGPDGEWSRLVDWVRNLAEDHDAL